MGRKKRIKYYFYDKNTLKSIEVECVWNFSQPYNATGCLIEFCLFYLLHHMHHMTSKYVKYKFTPLNLYLPMKSSIELFF